MGSLLGNSPLLDPAATTGHDKAFVAQMDHLSRASNVKSHSSPSKRGCGAGVTPAPARLSNRGSGTLASLANGPAMTSLMVCPMARRVTSRQNVQNDVPVILPLRPLLEVRGYPWKTEGARNYPAILSRFIGRRPRRPSSQRPRH